MVHQASLYGKENLGVVNFTLAYATAWKIIEFSFSLVPNRGPGSHGVVKMIKRLATHILASSFHPQLSLFFSLGLMLKSWILLKFIILLLFLMFLKQFQNVQNLTHACGLFHFYFYFKCYIYEIRPLSHSLTKNIEI